MEQVDILEDKKRELWDIRLSLKNDKEIESFDVAIDRVLAEIQNDPDARNKFWVHEKEILKRVELVFEEKKQEVFKQIFLFEELLNEKNITLPKHQLEKIKEWIACPIEANFYLIGKADNYPIQFPAKNINMYDKLSQLFKGIDDSNFLCEFVVIDSGKNRKDLYEEWDEFYPVEYEIDQLTMEFSRTETSKMYEYANGNYDFNEDWINEPIRGNLIKNFKKVKNFKLPYDTDLYLNSYDYLSQKIVLADEVDREEMRFVLSELLNFNSDLFLRISGKNNVNKLSHFEGIFDRKIIKIDTDDQYLEYLDSFFEAVLQNYKITEINFSELERIHYFLSVLDSLKDINGAREVMMDIISNPRAGTLEMFDDAGKKHQTIEIHYRHLFDGAYQNFFVKENLKNIDSVRFISNVRKNYASDFEKKTMMEREIQDIASFLYTCEIPVFIESIKAVINFNFQKNGTLRLSAEDGNFELISWERDKTFLKVLESIKYSNVDIHRIIFQPISEELNAPESPDQP